MPVRSLLLHVLLCLALIANGVGAAWAGTRGDCCGHAAQAVAPKTMPCHDAAMSMPMPSSDALHAHGMPAHDPQPPHGAPHACDGQCVCMTHAAGTLPPAPPGLAATPVHDTLADAPAHPRAPPVLPHPLRPPIRA